MKKTIGWILIIIGGFHCICGIICIPVAFIADDVTFAERIFILIGFMVFAFVNGLICRFGFKLKKREPKRNPKPNISDVESTVSVAEKKAAVSEERCKYVFIRESIISDGTYIYKFDKSGELFSEKKEGFAYLTDLVRQFGAKNYDQGIGADGIAWDSSLKIFRRTYQLEESGTYFLSSYMDEEGNFTKYSFDVEMSDDSHYEILPENMEQLTRILLRCSKTIGLLNRRVRKYCSQPTDNGGMASATLLCASSRLFCFVTVSGWCYEKEYIQNGGNPCKIRISAVFLCPFVVYLSLKSASRY